MASKVEYHFLEWNEGKVAKFWDFSANWTAWQEDYFSKQVGEGIINLLQHITPLKRRILDYGCGPGYLVEHLLRAGIGCEAVDFSTKSVELVNDKFTGDPLWKGAKQIRGKRLPFPDDTFDLIICIETIEHILPAYMETVLTELRRILKPQSGRLFMTTPNSENPARQQVYCPECGSVFHRYQHVSFFTKSTLSALLSRHGFTTVFSDVTNFVRFQQPLLESPFDWSPRCLKKLIGRILASFLDTIPLRNIPFGGYRFQQLIGSGPHLFWLGEKE